MKAKANTILLNMAQCRICKDIIYSKNRYDFRRCSCERIFIDGGSDYMRRGFTEYSDIIDLSVSINDELDAVQGEVNYARINFRSYIKYTLKNNGFVLGLKNIYRRAVRFFKEVNIGGSEWSSL